MKISSRLLVAFLLLISHLAAATSGYLLHNLLASPPSFPLLSEAYELLSQYGYDPLPPPPALEYGMIRGMLAAYGDPFTQFYEPPQTELTTNELTGEYGGIGVEVGHDEEGHFVLHPYPDSPAARAGVQDGDLLLRIDDLDITTDLTTDQVRAALSGPVGEEVILMLSRLPDHQVHTVSIRRERIAIPSVSWYLAPNAGDVGVVRVNRIAVNTSEEILQAVEALQARGARAIALDLRDNGGGVVEAGVEIAALFLKESTILAEQFRDQPVKTFSVQKAGPLAEIPLVVLINGGTASAAEIIAGALQAQQRALLVGETSYGKDSLQLVFTLKDGSSLHITAARWWIPGGAASIAGKGLQPDIPVSPEEGIDRILQSAVEHLTRLP